MIFWTREIAGWLLVALGLVAFWKVYEMSLQYHIFELIPMTVIGIFLFRGGIHLLKVAVAARACRETCSGGCIPTPRSGRPRCRRRERRPGRTGGRDRGTVNSQG